MIACNVLLPTVEMVCDPDYINQTIVMLVSNSIAISMHVVKSGSRLKFSWLFTQNCLNSEESAIVHFLTN